MTILVEMSTSILQALLNMTSDPDAWTDRTKSLATALHKVRALNNSNRWLVELSDEDIRTVHYILQVYTLNRPALRTRFNNWMCRQSHLYSEIYDGEKAA